MGRCTGTIAITICQFIVSPTLHRTKKKPIYVHICVFLPLTLCLNPCWCIFRAVFCASLCPLYLFTIFAWAPFDSCFFFFSFIYWFTIYTCSVAHAVTQYVCVIFAIECVLSSSQSSSASLFGFGCESARVLRAALSPRPPCQCHQSLVAAFLCK